MISQKIVPKETRDDARSPVKTWQTTSHAQSRRGYALENGALG